MVDFPVMAAIRLGYGLSPIHAPPATPQAVLDSVAWSAALPPGVTTTAARDAYREVGEMRKMAEKTDETADDMFRADLGDSMRAVELGRMAQAADAPVGFGERLVQFWSNHFTIRTGGLRNVAIAQAHVEDGIRPHINGSFAALLRSAITHPAMVIYLNQNRSIGPRSVMAVRNPGRGGLNENLGRELLELHTLGVDAAYGQDDVRQAALLLTGLTLDVTSDIGFDRKRAEPGPLTVLGRSYRERKSSLDDIFALLDDLAVHPATATHIARKLAVHFASDNPNPQLVADLAAVWQDTGGDLPSVYAVLVSHPALAASFRQKVRQPFEYVATSLRALGLSREAILAVDPKRLRRFLHVALRNMGQSPGEAPGPDGWPEDAAAWVQPQLLAERIDWAMTAPDKLLATMPDPRELLRTALGDTASEELVWATPKAESVREGVGLILASAELNRR